MSDNDVRAALVQAYLDAFTPGAVPPTEYENVPFNATGLSLWTSVSYLPGQPAVATFGDGGEDEVRGYLQVDINIPRGKGEKPQFDVVQTLQNFFTAGLSLSYNNGTATIISCGNTPGRQVDTWYRRSVSIYFYARTTRPILTP